MIQQFIHTQTATAQSQGSIYKKVLLQISRRVVSLAETHSKCYVGSAAVVPAVCLFLRDASRAAFSASISATRSSTSLSSRKRMRGCLSTTSMTATCVWQATSQKEHTKSSRAKSQQVCCLTVLTATLQCATTTKDSKRHSVCSTH